MSKIKYICFVAGKSGGHIIPALTYANNLLRNNPSYKIIFFSTDTQLDIDIIKQYSIVTYHIPINSIVTQHVSLNSIVTYHIPLKLGNFPGKKIWLYPLFIIQFFIAFLISFKYLLKFRAQEVISFGGYISIPVCLAAYLQRISISIFELNAIPGKAAKFLAPIANKIFICFAQAKKFFNKSKIIETNYPIRFNQKDKLTKIDANILLGLDPKKKTLLILGGSQGSKFINTLIINFLQKYLEFAKEIQIIHQTGAGNINDIEKFYQHNNLNAQVFDFLPELKLYYNASDLIISRAGAGSLFEINFFDKQSIIIPLQAKADDHQTENAHAMAETNPIAFAVMNQKLISENPQEFYNLILAKLTIN